MIQANVADMPHDFPKRVHQALRVWYKQGTDNVLGDLLLFDQNATPDVTTPRLLSNQVLMNGLDQIKSLDADAADLLERRFLNTETAREVAYSFNVTADVIYQRQRSAIEQLARVIWDQEQVLREQQAQRIEARLDAPTYTRLFGVDENLTTLREHLQTDADPWILAVEGMGGVGKTTLADALVRRLASDIYFRDIAWITVRQRLFRLTGGVEALAERPSLTPAGLVDRLIDQFELETLRRRTAAEKLSGVQRYLRERRSLIVIDNLETIVDYHALLPRIRELVNPSKCLITTRYSLQGEGGVYIFPLQPLSQKHTVALIRYEAQSQGLRDLAQASEDLLTSIHNVTGGNPLATKLVIGKLHTFALPVVLEQLTAAQDKPVQGLLEFLHADAWHTLDRTAQRLMQALLLVPDRGGTIEQLAAATNLTMAETAESLRFLVQRSLVTVKGDIHQKRYGLPQLTRTFVEHLTAQETS